MIKKNLLNESIVIYDFITFTSVTKDLITFMLFIIDVWPAKGWAKLCSTMFMLYMLPISDKVQFCLYNELIMPNHRTSEGLKI